MKGCFTDVVNTRETAAPVCLFTAAARCLSQGHLADGREVLSC